VQQMQQAAQVHALQQVNQQLQQQIMMQQMHGSMRRREDREAREADKKKIEELETKIVQKNEEIAEIKVVSSALITQIHEEVAANLKMEKDTQLFVMEKKAAMAELSEENGKLAKQIHIEVACKREKEEEVQRMTMELTEKNEKLAILESEKEELTNNLEEMTISNRLMQEQIKARTEQYDDIKLALTKNFNEQLAESKTEREQHVSELKKRIDADHETAVRLMNEVDEKDEMIKELEEEKVKMNEEVERLRKIERAHKRIEELENDKVLGFIPTTGFCWLLLIMSLLLTAVTSVLNWNDVSDKNCVVLGINIGLAVLDLFALVDIGNRTESSFMACFRFIVNMLAILRMNSCTSSYFPIVIFRLFFSLAYQAGATVLNEISVEAQKLKELTLEEVKEEIVKD
ncbi:hypothetical protein PFISCL1PPCAC_9577, partial [Pristionchus fissidentatus]